MVPLLFIVVKSEFQGKGAGKILMERLHDIVKKRYSFIVLSVIKENKQAIDLFKKFRYRVSGKKKEFCYMINAFNVKGEIASMIFGINQYVKSGLHHLFNQPNLKYISLSIYVMVFLILFYLIFFCMAFENHPNKIFAYIPFEITWVLYRKKC